MSVDSTYFRDKGERERDKEENIDKDGVSKTTIENSANPILFQE